MADSDGNETLKDMTQGASLIDAPPLDTSTANEDNILNNNVTSPYIPPPPLNLAGTRYDPLFTGTRPKQPSSRPNPPFNPYSFSFTLPSSLPQKDKSPQKERIRNFSGPAFTQYRTQAQKDVTSTSSPDPESRDSTPLPPKNHSKKKGAHFATDTTYSSHHTHESELVSQINNLKIDLNTLLTLKESIPSANNSNDLSEAVAAKVKSIESLKEQLKRIENTKKKLNRFSIPKDPGTPCRQDLMDFLPSKGGVSDLYTLLFRITCTAREQSLNHRDLRTLLVHSLSGKPLALYRSMQQSSLQEIFDALENRFLERESFSSYTSQLHAFTRNKNEGIRSAMERAQEIIRKASIPFPPEEKKARLHALAHSILLRILKPATRRYIERIEEKTLEQEGTSVPIPILIGHAEDGEVFFGDRDVDDKTITHIDAAEINEVTGPSSRDTPKPLSQPRDRNRFSVDKRRQNFRDRHRSSSRERRDALLTERRTSSARPQSPKVEHFGTRETRYPSKNISFNVHDDPLYFHPHRSRQEPQRDTAYQNYTNPHRFPRAYSSDSRYRPRYDQRYDHRHDDRRGYYRPFLTTSGPLEQTLYIPPHSSPYLYQQMRRGNFERDIPMPRYRDEWRPPPFRPDRQRSDRQNFERRRWDFPYRSGNATGAPRNYRP